MDGMVSASRIAALVALLWLAACTASRQVAFNEADFAATAGHGSGTISGRVFAVLDGDRTVGAGHDVVALAPVNAYTAENIQRRFVNGENLRSADRRIDKYARGTTTDGDGNFVIRGIPAGDYFVQTEVSWTTQHRETDNDGIEENMNVDHHKLIYARVSLKNGQTARVTSWNQSGPVHDAIYAYGGNLSRPHHQVIGGP